MKQPFTAEHFETPRGKAAARAIADLKQAALRDLTDSENVFAARELLQIALLAAAAVKEVNDEDEWAYRDLIPVSEHWPVLFNGTTDLAAYRSLPIGHQLLQSKNPKKRGAGSGLFAFLAKELISRLEILRTLAHFPADFDATVRDKFIASQAATQRRRNLADAGSDLPAKTLADFHERIASYTPTWAASLVSLPDLTAKTSNDWKKHGQNLFREAFPRPEKISALRKLILDAEAQQYDSVLRTRIVFRVGKAITSASLGLEPEEG